MSASITVVAAIIQQDGRILICQRRRGDRFEFKWEFPGGKVKEGESPQQALARELREELNVSAQIGEELYRTRHRYAELDRDLELLFFSATVGPGPVTNLAFEQIVWAERARLPDYDFLPADRELVARLARSGNRKPKIETR
jgi:mutator protein MutT